MKLILILISLAVIGCADNKSGALGACSNWMNGTLLGDNGETYTFNSDCSGSSVVCAETYKIEILATINLKTDMKVTVLSTNGLSVCNPVGEYTCVFQRDLPTDPDRVYGLCDGTYLPMTWVNRAR